MNGKRYVALMEALTASGFHHHFEGSFDAKLSGIRRRGRLLCVARRTSRGFSGPSFWVHLSGHEAHLGLWSGLLFRTDRVDQVNRLVVELMEHAKGRGIPTKLPSGMARRYYLKPADAEA